MKSQKTRKKFSFQEMFDKCQIFENCSRRTGQDLNEFLTQWNDALKDVQSVGLQMSENMLACKLLMKVNLHQEDEEKIISLTSDIDLETDICPFIISLLESNEWRESIDVGNDLVESLLQIKQESDEVEESHSIEMFTDPGNPVLNENPELRLSNLPGDLWDLENAVTRKEKNITKSYKCGLCPETFERLGKLRLHCEQKHDVTLLAYPEDLNTDQLSSMEHTQAVGDDHNENRGPLPNAYKQLKNEENNEIKQNTDSTFPVAIDDKPVSEVTIDGESEEQSDNEFDSLQEDKKPGLVKFHQCDLCGKWFYRPGRLKAHYESVHNLSGVDLNKRRHSTKRLLGNKAPKSEKKISRAKKKKDPVKKFHHCDLCKKLFLRPIVLKEHLMASHSDVLSIEEINRRYNAMKQKQIASVTADVVANSKMDALPSNIEVSTVEEEPKSSLYIKYHQCKFCGKWYNRPGKLKAHCKTAHSLSNIDVNEDNHTSISLPQDMAPVKELDDWFADSEPNEQKEDMFDEFQKEYPVKYHCCEFCGKWVNRPWLLKQHYRLEHDIDDSDALVNKALHLTKSVRGPVHPKSLAQAGSEKQVLTSVRKKRNSARKVIECQVCNAKFFRRITLKEHQLDAHADVLSLDDILAKFQEAGQKEVIIPECKICDKKFTKIPSYKLHMKIHSGEKKYKCDECDAAFFQSGALRYHKIKHTGKRNFKCDQCANDYLTSGSLLSHIRRDHLKERPYKCDICDYAALKQYDLRRHKLSHVNERPVKCDICEKAFKDKVALRAHTKKIHSAEPVLTMTTMAPM